MQNEIKGEERKLKILPLVVRDMPCHKRQKIGEVRRIEKERNKVANEKGTKIKMGQEKGVGSRRNIYGHVHVYRRINRQICAQYTHTHAKIHARTHIYMHCNISKHILNL